MAKYGVGILLLLGGPSLARGQQQRQQQTTTAENPENLRRRAQQDTDHIEFTNAELEGAAIDVGSDERRGTTADPPERRAQEIKFTELKGAAIDVDPDEFNDKLDRVLKKGELSKIRTCETYSMSHYGSNYNTPEIEEIVPYAGAFPYRAQQWGRHALQWKGYVWGAPSSARVYDSTLAGDLNWSGYGFPCTPFWIVDSGDATILNDLEMAPPMYYGSNAEVNGQPVAANNGLYKVSIGFIPDVAANPNGSWMVDNASSPVNGAILAAIYMHLWGTPVYANAFNAYPNANQMAQIVFEKVRLCVDGFAKPHQACGWGNYNSAISSTGSGYNCQTPNNNLSLDSVTFRVFPWELPFANLYYSWLTPSITMPGGNWATSGYWGCPTYQQGSGCVLVFDPPEEESSVEALQALKKRAAAMEEIALLPVLGDDFALEGVEKAKEMQIPEDYEKEKELQTPGFYRPRRTNDQCDYVK